MHPTILSILSARISCVFQFVLSVRDLETVCWYRDSYFNNTGYG